MFLLLTSQISPLLLCKSIVVTDYWQLPNSFLHIIVVALIRNTFPLYCQLRAASVSEYIAFAFPAAGLHIGRRSDAYSRATHMADITVIPLVIMMARRTTSTAPDR